MDKSKSIPFEDFLLLSFCPSLSFSLGVDFVVFEIFGSIVIFNLS